MCVCVLCVCVCVCVCVCEYLTLCSSNRTANALRVFQVKRQHLYPLDCVPSEQPVCRKELQAIYSQMLGCIGINQTCHLHPRSQHSQASATSMASCADSTFRQPALTLYPSCKSSRTILAPTRPVDPATNTVLLLAFLDASLGFGLRDWVKDSKNEARAMKISLGRATGLLPRDGLTPKN